MIKQLANGITKVSITGNNQSGTTGVVTPGTTVTIKTPYTVSPSTGYSYSNSTSATGTKYSYKASVNYSSNVTGTEGGTTTNKTFTFTMPNSNVTVNAIGSYTVTERQQVWTAVTSYGISGGFTACVVGTPGEGPSFNWAWDHSDYYDYKNSLEDLEQNKWISLISQKFTGGDGVSATISVSVYIYNGGANYKYKVKCSGSQCHCVGDGDNVYTTEYNKTHTSKKVVTDQ